MGLKQNNAYLFANVSLMIDMVWSDFQIDFCLFCLKDKNN